MTICQTKMPRASAVAPQAVSGVGSLINIFASNEIINKWVNACLTFYYSKKQNNTEDLLYGDLLWCEACQCPDLKNVFKSKFHGIDLM